MRRRKRNWLNELFSFLIWTYRWSGGNWKKRHHFKYRKKNKTRKWRYYVDLISSGPEWRFIFLTRPFRPQNSFFVPRRSFSSPYPNPSVFARWHCVGVSFYFKFTCHFFTLLLLFHFTSQHSFTFVSPQEISAWSTGSTLRLFNRFQSLLIFQFNFPCGETNTKIYLFEMKSSTKYYRNYFMRKQSCIVIDRKSVV